MTGEAGIKWPQANRLCGIINANASLLVIWKYNQPTQFSEAPHLSVRYKAH